MSGAVPLLPLYAFMAWTGKNFTFKAVSAKYEYRMHVLVGRQTVLVLVFVVTYAHRRICTQ
jgi:hypothetical protein